jgi:hypothetical protein
MRITKRNLRKIIKEEKTRLLLEQEDMSSNTTPPDNEHHWPRVDWTNVGELADKWVEAEEKAFDKGDPSMMGMGDTVTDAKKAWSLQVDNASLDMENELTKRVRQVALETMQEFTNNLINGDYA